jgi:hypothetical protein
MSPNQNHEDTTPSNAGSLAVLTNVVKAIGKQLPSAQEEQGDDKLSRARDLVKSDVVQTVEELESDVRVIEEKIT